MTDIAEAPSTLRTYAGHTMSAALSLLAAGLLGCQAVIWLKPLSPNLSLIEQFAVHLLSLATIGMCLALVLRRWVQMAILAALASNSRLAGACCPSTGRRGRGRVEAQGRVGQPVVCRTDAPADGRIPDGKRRGHHWPDRGVGILATGFGAAVREVSAQSRLLRDGAGV